MPKRSLLSYLQPWKMQRELEAERVAALRLRDGDRCARCRRPIRFDLPRGHDRAAAVEKAVAQSGKGADALDNLRLCHVRCNSAGWSRIAALRPV